MRHEKRETAVSPVIGTILLVAITVVLIAVIVAVVMGLGNAEDGKKVGMNAKPADKANATLLLYGGASIPELVKLEMIDQGSPYGFYVELWNSTSQVPLSVGISYLAENVAQPPKTMDVYDTIINVKGTFTDGSEVVLLIQPITFYDVKMSASAPTLVTMSLLTAEIGAMFEFRIDYNNAKSDVTECKIKFEKAKSWYDLDGCNYVIHPTDKHNGYIIVTSTHPDISGLVLQAKLSGSTSSGIWIEVSPKYTFLP